MKYNCALTTDCVICKGNAQLKAGDDAASVELVEDRKKESLAFDHMAILQDAKKLFRS